MSKKTVEVFQSKITRNDRFAQMSHQEKVIEQKKKEIQARLEQKLKTQVVTTSETKTSTTITSSTSKPVKTVVKVLDKKSVFNTFSNDGSFLDQFKQMKDKKIEQKLKSFKSRDSDKSHSEERSKTSRWSQPRSPVSPKESRVTKPRISRFSDKPAFEQKINITTTYSNLLSQPNFEQISPQNVMGQPLLKNHPVPPPVPYPQPITTESVIVAPPVLLNMPPPQIIQSTMVGTTTTIITTDVANLITPSTVLTGVTLAPPLPSQTILQDGGTTNNVLNVQPNIELASIPPPAPIQIHNIPDSINTIQLTEIPNPKPLDLLNIPTPNECIEQNIADADFIKNIPPPNKSIPPPTLTETMVNILPTPTCLPPPNILPPQSQNILQSQSQNILVQTIPPPQITQITVQNLAPPPPPPPPQQTLIQTLIQGPPVGVPPPPSNNIPSLMAQPVLPPPGMVVPPMNMSCPPPMLQTTVSCSIIQPPPPVFVTQPPPMVGQMPPMNIPPPTTMTMGQSTMGQSPMVGTYHDMNTGFFSTRSPPLTDSIRSSSTSLKQKWRIASEKITSINLRIRTSKIPSTTNTPRKEPGRTATAIKRENGNEKVVGVIKPTLSHILQSFPMFYHQIVVAYYYQR